MPAFTFEKISPPRRGPIAPIANKKQRGLMVAILDLIPSGRRVSIEYALIGGVNDQPKHAAEVVKLIRRGNLPAKVNLIAWNPGPGIPYAMPSPEDVTRFQQYLIDHGIPAFLRRPRGRDIYAACGQLKRTIEV